MIFSENRYPPPELGCSRVLALYTWTQIGNIRFAVVKPEGRLFRDHALNFQFAPRRCETSAEKAHIAAGADKAKAAFGKRDGALAGVGIDACDFSSLVGRFDDFGQRGVD